MVREWVKNILSFPSLFVHQATTVLSSCAYFTRPQSHGMWCGTLPHYVYIQCACAVQLALNDNSGNFPNAIQVKLYSDWVSLAG